MITSCERKSERVVRVESEPRKQGQRTGAVGRGFRKGHARRRMPAE